MPKTYLEYKILNNRPGLLGAIASTIGLLGINILNVASVFEDHRGFLLEGPGPAKARTLLEYLRGIKDLEVTVFRKPTLEDFLALKHGKRIKRESKNPPKYSFGREDLNILVDFLGRNLKNENVKRIGFLGRPRVGKSETSIAACVQGNKRWVIISSTLVRKIARTSLTLEERSGDNVFLIDAITSWQRSTPQHINLVEDVLKGEGTFIIEHPRIFLAEKGLKEDFFDLIIELKGPGNENTEEIFLGHSFSSFDIS